MRSVRAYGARDLRMVEEPVPVRKADEALVEVKAVGICGSDLHWYMEGGIGDAVLDQPLVLGHEMAGIVRSGEHEGERVALEPAIACGTCEFCVEGHPNLCPEVKFAGHGHQDGGLREYLSWPSRNLHGLPGNLTFEDGVLLEPSGTALLAADLAHIRVGMTIGVYGCGPIGLLVVQLMRILGAVQIFVTDRLAHRLEAAIEFGATQAFLAGEGEEQEHVLAATAGRGVDAAFEAAGDNLAVETAIATTKPGGTVALIGIPADDRTSFQASVARRKGLTIKLVRRMKPSYPRAIALAASGMVRLAPLVTHRFPLEQYQAAFDVASRRDGIKTLIEPSA